MKPLISNFSPLKLAVILRSPKALKSNGFLRAACLGCVLSDYAVPISICPPVISLILTFTAHACYNPLVQSSQLGIRMSAVTQASIPEILARATCCHGWCHCFGSLVRHAGLWIWILEVLSRYSTVEIYISLLRRLPCVHELSRC